MIRSFIRNPQAVLLLAACRMLKPAGLLAAAVLYGGVPAMASEAVTTSPAPPPPALGAPLPLPPGAPGPWVPPAPKPPQKAALPEPEAAEAPHIALLLPLRSATFGRHAEAVRNGFLAAAKAQGRTALPLRVYSVGDDPRHIAESYRRALAAGARAVVGPLTRDGVTTIADGPVPVPTLALNVPEPGARPPVNLYMLSLHVEAEARQLARFAYEEGRRKAITVKADTPLMRRIHLAFVEEFSRLGGAHVAEYAFSGDPAALARLRQAAALGVADMAFLALDFARARLVRPYLDPLALYATSQVYPGSAGPLAGFDLTGVRFLDMPWLLQPDHPAVMVYPRSGYREAIDLERFYALGIDAFRIAQDLASGKTDVALDGVTGRITLGHDQHFARGLTAARFDQGKLVTVTGRGPQ